ncbi:MAG: M23 family metallopeptidase [Opitutaceae bacterium]|jgi:murein DD-endopeptidase MepM/ murein hydrolase activator NlpD
MQFRHLAAAILMVSSLRAERIEISWPTPAQTSPSWRPDIDTLQSTASGEPETGGFGCVRSNGYRFHEGIDIKATKRDSRGEAADEIFAAMDGVVRHINTLAGESNYGRYIVLEHPDASPQVYTLYAHLSRIAPGLAQGGHVKRGQVIATMGRTSGGQAIPRDRAHLHFEIGLFLSRDFQSWFLWKKFGGANSHGQWNGMNLMGIDPIDFFHSWQSGKVDTFAQYLAGMQTAVKLRVATTRTPDFLQRYPTLQTRENPAGLLGGWEIRVNETGLPFSWTPLEMREVAGMRPNEAIIVDANEDILRHHHCKTLVDNRHGRKQIGKDLRTVLELTLGLR